MSAIETQNLEKRYGRVRALADLSIEIPGGQLWLISGANGAGKSTLLRVLAGLTRPTRGGVRVLGVNPFSRAGATRRSRVGFLGQEPGLYAELTLRENLAFCSRLYGLPAERMGQLIRELELEPVADQRLRTLSLGYRRRSGLARALLSDPELLLLDEPWNGLDLQAADALTRRLAQHRRDGRTALIVAHSAEALGGLIDQELRLARGALAALVAGPRA